MLKCIKKFNPIDASVRDFIFKKRPLLKELIEKNGDKSVLQYVTDNVNQTSNFSDEKRKKEFIETVKSLVDKKLGKNTADELASQLSRHFYASTADHHSFLNTSLPINSNIVLSFVNKYVLVLTCASISQNNEDYPRGLLFHEKRIPFLSSKNRNSTVYGFRPISLKEIGINKDNLPNDVFNLFTSKSIVESENLCDQITKFVFYFWRMVFPETNTNLIYLDFETLVSELILKYHLNKDSLIYKLIFNSNYSDALNRLSDAMEFFLRQSNLNTFLFWGLSNEKKYRISLKLQNNQLISNDGSFQLEYSPESIRDALLNKKIMPNMLLVFITLHLYYGLNCFGGFNQLHYLKYMQKVYNELKLDPILSRSIAFLNYELEFLFLQNNNDTIAINGMDLLLFKRNDLSDEIKMYLKTTRLKDLSERSFYVVNKILCTSA